MVDIYRDEHRYPDVEALWQDLCQLKYLEGVGAFLVGLPVVREEEGYWTEVIVNSDLILRFFTAKISEIPSVADSTEDELEWLRTLALLSFIEHWQRMQEPQYPRPKPSLPLIQALFLFYRDHRPIEFDEEVGEVMAKLASEHYSWLKKQPSSSLIPEALTPRLCAEVKYVAEKAEGFNKNYFEGAPFMIEDMVSQALFTHRVDKDAPAWTITSILEYCDRNGGYPHESCLIRFWLLHEEARKLMEEVIEL